MKIESFISKYNIQKIKKLEQKDPQFLALKESWEKIQNKDENLFLYLTLQCALVSYQIAWTWELRRQEFGDKIQKDRKISSLRLAARLHDARGSVADYGE